MIRVYHFVGATLRDGRPVPDNGVWLEHDGPVIPCESGLHGSEHPFDALRWAPGSTLCLCDLDGDLQRHGGDKVAGRRRRIVKRFDATTLLRRFACDMALSVAHSWQMPEIVRRYLETMDETIRLEAWAAAWGAAQNTARYAAWGAAQNTARYAARGAVRDEFKRRVDAAWDAASAAARDEFKRRVDAAFEAIP